LDKRGDTRSDMVLHVLQTALYRKLQDRNVIQKEAEKILKYKNLTIEIQRMWNVKTRAILVIIGVTGTISK
jgi:hypothetical protein